MPPRSSINAINTGRTSSTPEESSARCGRECDDLIWMCIVLEPITHARDIINTSTSGARSRMIFAVLVCENLEMKLKHKNNARIHKYK